MEDAVSQVPGTWRSIETFVELRAVFELCGIGSSLLWELRSAAGSRRVWMR